MQELQATGMTAAPIRAVAAACSLLVFGACAADAQAPGSHRPKSADDWAEAGREQSRRGDHEAAARSMENAFRINPRSAAFARELGDEYSDLWEHRKAIEVYVRAGELGGYSADLLETIGFEYYLTEQYEQAKGYYLRSLAADGERYTIYERYSELYAKLGDRKNAIESARRALSFPHPDDWSAGYGYFTLAEAYAGADVAADRRDALRAAYGLWPCYIYAMELGKVSEELEEFDEALQAYENAIARLNDRAEAHLGRGRVLWAIGREPEAEREYQTLLRLDPKAAAELGWLLSPGSRATAKPAGRRRSP